MHKHKGMLYKYVHQNSTSICLKETPCPVQILTHKPSNSHNIYATKTQNKSSIEKNALESLKLGMEIYQDADLMRI